jgi:SNF2 family DNA or RNA helicase
MLPEGARARRKHELAQPYSVRVVSTEMLRSYDMPTDLNTVVIDEAHHIRNPKSIQSARASDLCATTKRVHLLTATPFYKEDHDIWHLLHVLQPDAFPSYWNFIREWYTVNWYAPYAPRIYGVKPALRDAFRAMLATYMLQRDYTDVGRQLPPLIEKVLTFELPTPLRKHYNTLKTQWQLLGEPIESVGAVYASLRQLTLQPKIDIVKAIVDSIPKEPIFIYTHYVESAHILTSKLRTHLHTPLLLTGETPPTIRAELLADQKRTGNPTIVIATIDALNEGVNLEHIRHVIYAEESYVRGKHNQTLARFRRDRGTLSTAPPVMAYYVRARKTVDERIPVIRNSRGTAGDRTLAADLAHQYL